MKTTRFFAAVLALFFFLSCQKEEMVSEPDSGDSLSDELMTKAPDEDHVSGAGPLFSVSPTKKVRFTKGNLYWNGNDWKFESAQTDYPRNWSSNHVGHFCWTKTASAARAYRYFDGQCSDKDKFFADGSDPNHMLTVGDQSGLYVLSMAEWNYLISEAPKGRGAGDSYFKTGVTVNGVANCLVIAPDGYSGKIASSYDAASWVDAEASGLVCLPPAGTLATFNTPGSFGHYWSSSPVKGNNTIAFGLWFRDDAASLRFFNLRELRHSIRLVCTVDHFGTAKATIGGKEVDVEWVQLWKGGPKFAVKNVGADTCTDKGSKMTYAAAVKTGKDYVWGSNWRTPEKKEMGLLDPNKVKCKFCQVGGRYGFKFTGVQNGYTGNSLFFPSDYGIMDYTIWSVGRASYWSSTMAPGIGKAWAFRLFYMRGKYGNSWGETDNSDKLYVRPVLNE